MRIVIDLQAAQSSGSRNRGIGRYSLSLAKAMVLNRGEHEIVIALSGLFPETIEPIRAAFEGLLPQENIRVWHVVASVSKLSQENDWRRLSAEKVREAFLVSLRPDIVHVASLFEGLGDDAVTSVGAFASIPTAVTLYDLIPFIHRSPYLDNPSVEAWYVEKLEYLRRANLWLAISESSRQEGLQYLNLPADQVVNISTAADSHFQSIEFSAVAEQEIRQQYGLLRSFVMYTGGIDHRKNIEGLIRAFALLPLEIRREHQLAIVCAARPEDKQLLIDLVRKHGLNADDLVLTGFVPEDHLIALYNFCKLFVFPSWHEGFGLPALEAMHCGAPVIGANTSSLPEVIGWEQALFDPRSDEAIAAKMEQALCDEAFRAELLRHGARQARMFSWDDTAKRAIAAFERLHVDAHKADAAPLPTVRRPKLAYVSPLPPARSGIADYSAELLPELARHYDIDLVVSKAEVNDAELDAVWPVRTAEWLVEHASEYDRVLYHFGNSAFHSHMFDLLAAVPGVAVLHDFFLSGVAAHMAAVGSKPGFFLEELYSAHGYPAVQEFFNAGDVADVVWKYPCNLSVLQDSLGMIVHSENSRRLARQWYGTSNQEDWAVIPHMRQFATRVDRSAARRELGIQDNAFVVCSFGMMGPTKLNHRLLDAWLNSSLCQDSNCHLVFVGENGGGDYGLALSEKVHLRKAQGRVRITGWADTEVFRRYLSAADVGVQLRTLSRGETSGTVLDCMNYGLATIVNANGSMADLPDAGVWKLPDEFSDQQLVEALETLRVNHTRRLELGRVAREIICEAHSPRRCADQYFAAIEQQYRMTANGVPPLTMAIGSIDRPKPADVDLMGMAESIARSISLKFRCRQLLVDISELVLRDARSEIQQTVRSILKEWLANPPQGLRIEPVYESGEAGGYRYARNFTLALLDCPGGALNDDPAEFASGDFFLGLDLQSQVVAVQQTNYQEMRRQGVYVKLVACNQLPTLRPDIFVDSVNHDNAV